MAPVEETIRYCGMRWLEPFVLHASHDLGAEGLLHDEAGRLKQRIADWRSKR